MGHRHFEYAPAILNVKFKKYAALQCRYNRLVKISSFDIKIKTI
jgi:hypothetical protein